MYLTLTITPLSNLISPILIWLGLKNKLRPKAIGAKNVIKVLPKPTMLQQWFLVALTDLAAEGTRKAPGKRDQMYKFIE